MSTRRPLTSAELADVVAPVGRPVAERSLGGGFFASVQAVDLADGRTVVVKTGQPDDATGLLSHEQRLLHGEIALLRLAAAVPGVPAPAVLHADLTRSAVDVDVLVAELMPGTSWDAARAAMAPDAVAAAGRQVGAILAGLGTVVGDRFGYPAAASGVGGETWPAAFDAMVAALLDDAVRWGVDVAPDRVRAALADERSRAALAEVTTPRLVHMDLWPGNVLLDPTSGAVTGVIDFERGLFGDPLMDLVGHDPFRVEGVPADAVAGYVAAGGPALPASAERRLALYRLYLTLIMTIEVVPRGYDWPDLDGYVARLVEARGALLRMLGA